ncbi:Uncharacterized protein ChrSV_1918 [Chromobacterium vaccinii]|nr:Uncharacterized protein ChrSW_1918 [Chromobacterium vaccinii]QND89376.1 Uncharacterized protein ChrSV_1918 [Chromobacterium vaccinii]
MPHPAIWLDNLIDSLSFDHFLIRIGESHGAFYRLILY